MLITDDSCTPLFYPGYTPSLHLVVFHILFQPLNHSLWLLQLTGFSLSILLFFRTCILEIELTLVGLSFSCVVQSHLYLGSYSSLIIFLPISWFVIFFFFFLFFFFFI